jgi:hypothetical protein
VHWEKYPGNPNRDKSSGIVVPDGSSYRLYTMHAQVDLFQPRAQGEQPAASPIPVQPQAK